MTVPNDPQDIRATTDGTSAVTITHDPSTVQSGSLPVLGYKYFRSLATEFDAIALAQADINAHLNAVATNAPPVDPTNFPAPAPTDFGGIAANPAVLADIASPNIDMGGPTYGGTPQSVQFSRHHTPGMICFTDVIGPPPAAGQDVFYAIVAWSEEGPGGIAIGEVLHIPNSSPAIANIQARETEVDVIFDQPVNSSVNRPGEGFSLTVNGITRFADQAEILVGQEDTIRLTIAGTISHDDYVLVDYDQSAGDLSNIPGTDFVQSVTDYPAYNVSNHAALLSSVIAQLVIYPEQVWVTFSRPVLSTDYSQGLSFSINGETIGYESVEAGEDPRRLIVTFPNSFQYGDEVILDYDQSQGDWTSDGYPIDSISGLTVTNASRIGTPDSDYPLSSVVREQLDAEDSAVLGKVGIDLNFVDRQLVNRYGPVVIDFGGTFGVTNDNPDGVFISQDLLELRTGMEVTKSFRVQARPDQAALAAAEWQEQITERVGIALGTLRTKDQRTILGNRTVRQI